MGAHSSEDCSYPSINESDGESTAYKHRESDTNLVDASKREGMLHRPLVAYRVPWHKMLMLLSTMGVCILYTTRGVRVWGGYIYGLANANACFKKEEKKNNCKEQRTCQQDCRETSH